MKDLFKSFEKDELFNTSSIRGGECDTTVTSGNTTTYDKNVDDSTTYQGQLDDDVQDCQLSA